MNKKKTIIAAIVLLLVLLVGGAIAYFTDHDEEENVFTIGKVDIELSEPTWVSTGKTKAEGLMPGDTIEKDPTVTVASDSEDAWVFVKVEVPCLGTTELFTYTTNTGWTELTIANELPVACTSGGTATHVYYYGSGNTLTALAKAANASTPTPTSTAVFSNVTLLSTLTGNEGLTGDKEIVITGYGIQTEGLTSTTPAAVWANFD